MMKYIGKVRYVNELNSKELGNYIVLGQEYNVTDDSCEGLLILDLNASPSTFYAATPDHFELVEDTEGLLSDLLL